MRASYNSGDSEEDVNRLDEFELDAETESESLDTGPVTPRGPHRPWPWIALGLIVVVTALVAYWWFRSRPEPAVEPPVVAEPAPAEAPEAEPAEPPLDLPPLDASDELLREIVQTLSSHPRLVTWLATDRLVERFTTSVVNISEGLSPRSHLEHMVPAEPFTVRRRDGEIVPSAKSYARYDALAEIIAALDTEGTVRAYRRLEPLFDEAYADLGYPNHDFDEALIEALDHLLATPVRESPRVLIEEVDVYVYADPELEELSMAQRQLLRTGPENTRRIQEKLAELRRELLETATP